MSDSAPVEILPTHTPALFATAVRRTAELLRAGEVVALPTETVYGLAANALDPRAVAKIFRSRAGQHKIPSSSMWTGWRWGGDA